MKKQRMLIGAVLTTGLGLTGLVSANASGAAAPSHDRTATATTIGATSGKAGQIHVCIIKGAPGKGKPAQGSGETTSGKAGSGKATSSTTTSGKATSSTTTSGATTAGKSAAGKTTIKVVNGKVYVNGKLLPKGKVSTKCKLPPLPPIGLVHGKGGVCIVEIGPGAGKSEKGTSGKSTAAQSGKTVKVVNGKVYVDGKAAPKGKPGDKCPLPPISIGGSGAKGGSTSKGGVGGAASGYARSDSTQSATAALVG